MLQDEKKKFTETYAKAIKEKFNRDLNEEELKAIDKQFDTIKVKQIDFRKQELDITGLTQKEFNQLIFRYQNDNLVYNRFILNTLNDIELLLVLMCEKQGIENPLGKIEEMAKELKKE